MTSLQTYLRTRLDLGSVPPKDPLRRFSTRVGSFAVLAVLAATLPAGCGGDGDDSAPSPTQLAPRVERPIEVGGTPTAIGVGEGAVWVADNTGGAVREIDPATRKVVGKPIQVGNGPSAIAVGEGGVWVASGDDRVYRIDPAERTAERAEIDVGDPRGIAVGEGSVWVTSSIDETVTRLDPTSLQAVGEPIPVGGRPGDVVVGDGRVWVVGNEDGTVTEIEASSGEVANTIEVGEFGAFALALSEDGLWVARASSRLANEIELVKIDPDSGEIAGEPIALPNAAIPVRLATGEGALWATLLGGLRPPRTKRLPAEVAYLPTGAETLAPERLEVGDQPSGIAVGEGAIWVTSADEGIVTPISPG
ncbi:MAG: Vgb family protein [Solirubrobacterales bacterium]